jgi:ribosome-associated heat shock protein Hsp15
VSETHETQETHDTHEIQRLDKWLWQTRFFKTRGLAQRMCSAGKVRINSQRVRKAHYALKAGDILTFTQGSRIRVVRILAMPERRGPAVEAQRCYEDVESEAALNERTNPPPSGAHDGFESK